ncbi:MAG: type III pantothenate kinase [Pseudomonadota bacterium]
MLLAIDIGNTTATLGLFDSKRLCASWRIPTAECAGVRVVARAVASRLGKRRGGRVDGVCIASVVPRLGRVFRDACRDLFGIGPLFATPRTAGIRIRRYDRRQIGADRLVGALAAYARCRRAVIVVDAGTAVTFDAVDSSGAYLGGAIAPGMRLAGQALREMTAKLPFVSLKRAGRAIGRTTRESIRSGICFGWGGLVDNLVRSIAKEMKLRPVVVATGGDARLIANASQTIDRIVPHLILEGLKIVWENNRK